MKTVYDYELGEKLHAGRWTDVYRATLRPSGDPVVVKLSRVSGLELRKIAKLQQEFEFGKSLGEDAAVRPLALQQASEGTALILEDFGGISLKQVIGNGRLAVRSFLKIASVLAAHLSKIHARGIIHKDVKPHNILINPDSKIIKYIDFGISSRLNLKKQHLGNPDVLEGSLPYISPEQTGRMNRMVDYRSDLYSLGVTFYELLTGRLPFEVKDSMELVHCHIARVPTPVHEFNDRVPPGLSAIIARLLAKNAEERYQSALGLKHDLDRCLERFESGSPLEFELGTRDFSGVFQISQKLYGREEQLDVLMNAFERVAGGACEMMLVSGYSGVGKSALVNEVHKPITARRGNFISGKYDQFQRNIPFSAIRQAFGELANLLLTESPESLALWRERILESVGENGQLLIEVIPGLEHILGRQPEVPQLSASESQNRFKKVFKSFVRAISRRDHPLVLFIDDLQWADSASLDLIQTLMTDPDNTHFLFIGAYRDNEVDPSHPVMLTVEDLRKRKVAVSDIVLPNLSPENVGLLIAEALLADDERIQELSKLVYHKTEGNAFFTTELLKNLYEHGHLSFNLAEQKWEWDAAHIRELNITDNVIELMTQKFDRLPPRTRRVAMLASCIGARFDLEILSIINEASPKETLADLWPAVEESMILPLDENYRLIRGQSELSEDGVGAEFRFAHDRVQQAAYSLIDPANRENIHLKIAHLLLDHTDESELEERVFDIVYQLNSGGEILEPVERSRAIRLNLQAAEKAVNSSAFRAALEYIEAALPLFEPDAWEKQHDLIFRAHHMKASCQWSSYQMEASWETTSAVLPLCRTEEERVLIYMLQTSLLFSLNRHYEATDVIREALRSLGMKIPDKATKLHIALEYVKFRLELGFRRPAEIVDLPEIEDRHMLNRCKILYNSVESSYMVEPDLMGLVSVMMARICLKYGHSVYSGVSFAMTALVVEGVLKQFKFAWEFSLLAQALNEKYPFLDARARIFFLNGNFTCHWVKPVEEHLPWIESAYRDAQESGNVHWGNYSIAFSRAQSLFFNRKSLEEILAENVRYYEFHARSGDREVTRNMYMLIEWINSMRGAETSVENYFEYDPEGHHDEMHTPGNFLVREYFFTLRMMEAYDRGDTDAALDWAWKGFAIVLEVLGVLLDYQQRFFYQLTYLKGRKRLGFWKRLKMGTGYLLNKFMLGLYVKSVPENFAAHHALLAAETAWAAGRIPEAEKLYERAAKAAEDSGFPFVIALANELAGAFYQEQEDREKLARLYFSAAVKAYTNWGAHGKAERLAREHNLSVGKDSPRSDSGLTAGLTTTYTTGMATGTLDIATVIKSSQAISGEIRLESLLARLIKFVIENAGAERVCLFMEKEGELFLEGENSTSMSEPVVLKSIPLRDARVAAGVVQFVDRTGQGVVLHDATREGSFTRDEYIQREGIRSLICHPITNQGRLLGLLYLENNLTTHAFTPGRMEVLGIIASQAAVSLENARLISEETERQKLEKEMEMARDVQMSILPATPADDAYNIATHMTPAESVGGDYYDYYLNSDGDRWIAIGDVTGHGLNSGLMMLMAQTGFSMYLNSAHRPETAELFTALNKTLHTNMVDRTGQGLYMTFTALRADAEGVFEHVGKHEDILVYRRATGKVERIPTDGFWIGILDDVAPLIKRARFKLEPGDFITLFTDGVIECRNRDGEQFEPWRLIETIEANAAAGIEQVKDAIVQNVLEFMDVMDDDITLFLMEKK